MQKAVLLEERAVDEDSEDPDITGAGHNVAFRPDSRGH